jgi:hypothetical protein
LAIQLLRRKAAKDEDRKTVSMGIAQLECSKIFREVTFGFDPS